MRVLYVASEAFPLAKTGGLADVSAALPAALRELDVDVRLLLPGYPQAIEQAPSPKLAAHFDDILGCGETRLLATHLPGSRVPLWLIDCPGLYGRSGGLYQDGSGNNWPDNALRFALLNHVAVMIANGEVDEQWRPDVVHIHDWHAGLVPLLLSRATAPRPATVLTIHNLAYQGVFAFDELPRLGLPDGPDFYPAIEFYGQLSFLKAAIRCADAITTVSPSYAREILTPEFGCGLDGLLRERSDRLSGIMNGADYRLWDPGSDPYLPYPYTQRERSPKRACKISIQEEMGLEAQTEAPLAVFASRLAHQKMPDVVLDALPTLLAQGMQFALVAEGDAGFEARFRELAARYPGRVSVHIGYDEPLAHRLLAGADILLHPSRYEPCGLAAIYALRYGVLPLARRVGGTADSIVDATLDNIQAGIATGFLFDEPNADDLIAGMTRALSLYRQPILWRQLQSNAMRQDFGWQHSARAYVDLYRDLAPGASKPESEPSERAEESNCLNAEPMELMAG